MLIDDIKKQADLIASPLPVFWIAQYKDGYEHLKIPKCNKCNNYIKVMDYKSIVCQTEVDGKVCANTCNFSWEVFDLNNGLFMEYDENGREIIPFNILPQDRLEAFYIYIKPKQQIVGFDMLNGEFNIDGTTVGAGVVVDRQLLAVSNQTGYYGEGLFHYRSMLSRGNNNYGLIWYKVGYTCAIKYADTVMMIAVHVPTLNPYIFSECHPK